MREAAALPAGKRVLAATALLRGLESKGSERHAEGFYSRKTVLGF
jgi:hypothetical protein